MFPLFQIGAGTLPNINIPDLSQVNIAEIIFSILKVSPTGDIVTDLVNLIFFPHIVIVLWLAIVYFSNEFTKTHKGISLLLAFAFYFFIIWNSWYVFIASLSQMWLALTVGISLFYFIFSKFIHPSATAARGQIAQGVGAKIWERRQAGKAIDRMNEDLKECKRNIDSITRDLLPSSGRSSDEKRALQEALSAWRMRELDLKAKIRELEKSKQFV